MIQLITIEPKDNTHGMLIVQAFNALFIEDGGPPDGNGDGSDGWVYGYGGNGYGGGYDRGYGALDADGDPNGDGGRHPRSVRQPRPVPEEWRVQ